MSSVVKKLINMVMSHEGDYDAVNRNSDGAGASVGIFQWPQRTGGLGTLLNGYYRVNPTLFVQVFGPSSMGLLQLTASRSLAPLDGALLWQEPWVSRFRLAGRQPEFQAVQDYLASEGPEMQAAFKGAKSLGFVTERSLAVLLDAAVTQGADYAVKAAREVQASLAGRTMPMKEVLEAYLNRTVAHFRSNVQPPPPKKKHLSWRQVGNEWHKYAGEVNLYRNNVRRRRGFIESVDLSDVLIAG